MYNPVFLLVTDNESKLPFYLKSIGANKHQEYISRPAGYPDYHWLHCTKGKGKLIIENNEYIINENMGFFLHPRIPHKYYALTYPWETYWITFNGYAAGSTLELLQLKSFELFHVTGMEEIKAILSKIYATAQSANSIRGYECSYMLYEFIIKAKNCISLNETQQRLDCYKKLQPVVDYIRNSYNKNPTLGEMASIIGVTPRHLCRMFKISFNMRPFVYLNSYRIKMAKELLISLDNPSVKEVALNTGFNDVSYFCAIFKKYEGMTPADFRKIHRSTP